MHVGSSEFHKISLRGTQAGPMPLTWGQGNMWESIVTLGPQSRRLNMSWQFPVENPVRVRDALIRIQNCLTRFDIFRVAFDRERTEQTFRAEAGVEVRVSETAHTGLRIRAFELDEPPIRLELLHRDGVVTHVWVVLSHLAFDGGACDPLTLHLRDAVEGRGLPAPGTQTEAMVAHERSDESVRKSDAVISHWVRTATRLPPGRGLMSTVPGSYSVVTIRSRAIAIAAEVLSRKSRVSVSGVILAALTRSIRREINRDLSTMLLVSNNRMHPHLSRFIGQTIGNGLLLLPDEEPGDPFLPYAKSVYSRAVTAYSQGRYDCIKWREVLGDISARGLATDLSYYFNDIRTDRRSWQGLEKLAGELKRGVTRQTSIEIGEPRDMSDATLFANLDSDGQECLIEVVCDDSRVPTAAATAALTALEALVVTEALAS